MEFNKRMSQSTCGRAHNIQKQESRPEAWSPYLRCTRAFVSIYQNSVGTLTVPILSTQVQLALPPKILVLSGDYLWVNKSRAKGMTHSRPESGERLQGKGISSNEKKKDSLIPAYCLPRTPDQTKLKVDAEYPELHYNTMLLLPVTGAYRWLACLSNRATGRSPWTLPTSIR